MQLDEQTQGGLEFFGFRLGERRQHAIIVRSGLPDELGHELFALRRDAHERLA